MLYLYCFEKYTLLEIGNNFGISESRVSQALKLIKKKFGNLSNSSILLESVLKKNNILNLNNEIMSIYSNYLSKLRS